MGHRTAFTSGTLRKFATVSRTLLKQFIKTVEVLYLNIEVTLK